MTPLTPVRCPRCGANLHSHNAATGGGTHLVAERPAPGDYTLCWACGGFSVYDDASGTLLLRKPDDEEWAIIAADPSAQAVLAEHGLGTNPRHLGRRMRRRLQGPG